MSDRTLECPLYGPDVVSTGSSSPSSGDMVTNFYTCSVEDKLARELRTATSLLHKKQKEVAEAHKELERLREDLAVCRPLASNAAGYEGELAWIDRTVGRREEYESRRTAIERLVEARSPRTAERGPIDWWAVEGILNMLHETWSSELHLLSSSIWLVEFRTIYDWVQRRARGAGPDDLNYFPPEPARLVETDESRKKKYEEEE